tara:strand:+ start:175 stop:324 length:150 start_codon:yes stop_codon:yes gene_type:complete
MKKYSNSIIAALSSGGVILILKYGGIYRWWIFGIFLIVCILGYYYLRKK